jgi:hypothetical protein
MGELTCDKRLRRAWEGDQSPVLTDSPCAIFGEMKHGCRV